LSDARQADLPIIWVNPAFTEHTGYSLKEVIGRNCRFLQGPLTDRKMVKAIRDALVAGVSVDTKLLNYRKNGEAFWNILTIDPVRDAAGEVTHFLSLQRDGSSDHATVTELLDTKQQLSNVIEHIPGYIFRRCMRPDLTFHYPFLSRSLFRILGMPEDTDWSDNGFVSHMHPDDKADFLRSVIQSGLHLTHLHSEFRLVPPSGQEFWFRSDSTPHLAANGDVVWEGLAVNVTGEKASESKLSYLAHHDILTGLANRLLFRASVVEAIAKTTPITGRVALCYIDLDEFQILNEELGQETGDLVLQGVGQHLLAFAGRSGGSVARVGGDEFALLLPIARHDVDLHALSEDMRLDLLRPKNIGGRQITTEVCVGAALFTDLYDPVSCGPDERATELMKRADLALRRAKMEGPGCCRVYSADIDERVQNRMALRRSLQDGLTHEQFELHYQPIVDLASGEIVGAEALVRWNHPELGRQRPDLFIPYAESSGLIVPLGAWIMKTAMQQAELWRHQKLSPPRVAINLSGIQLQRQGFMETVERAFGETGANPADFEFELTEGTLIGAARETRRDLEKLRNLGFGLAIDDFGTGHSTLLYLRDFPVDKVKIDQAFVRQLVIDSNDALIIKAIVALSRSLRLDVVAEGIETIMQRDFLLGEGCKVGQGYLLSMPLSASEFGGLLESRQRLGPEAPRGARVI
jgi:diguanylate cyclase (GGDEF)-like protein/PAS domain S-box-containing protein